MRTVCGLVIWGLGWWCRSMSFETPPTFNPYADLVCGFQSYFTKWGLGWVGMGLRLSGWV